MRRMRSFIGIHSGVTSATLKSSSKTEIDTVAADNSVARWKSFNVLVEENKMVVASSDYEEAIEEDLSNFPLNRKHMHLVRYIYVDFTGELIDTFSNAIEVAGALADKLTAESGYFYIAILKDATKQNSTKTVLPSIFASSNYVRDVEDVVVAIDAVAGLALMPAEWAAITPECVENAAPSVGVPEPDPEPDPDPEPEDEGDGIVI